MMIDIHTMLFRYLVLGALGFHAWDCGRAAFGAILVLMAIAYNVRVVYWTLTGK